jgi:hypothetical protein
MKSIRMAAVGMALVAMTVDGHAAETCALFDDLTTLQIAAVQQRFMISALVCNQTSSYNAFVTGHQGELQRADNDLQAFFIRLNAATGIGDYHAYKTRLANTYSLVSAQHKDEFCTLTRAAMERSQSGETHSLREFILTQPLAIAIGYRSCGVTVPGEKYTNPIAYGGVSTKAVKGLSRSDYYFYDGRSLRPYDPYFDYRGRR